MKRLFATLLFLILSLTVCSQNTKGRFIDNSTLTLIAQDLIVCDTLRFYYNKLRIESVIQSNKSLKSLERIEYYRKKEEQLQSTIKEYKKQNEKLSKPKSWVWKIALGVAGGYVLNDVIN